MASSVNVGVDGGAITIAQNVASSLSNGVSTTNKTEELEARIETLEKLVKRLMQQTAPEMLM